MARLCGNSGYATFGGSDILTLTGWDAELDKGVKTFNDREGAGWQKTCSGNKKFSGTIKGNIDDQDNIATLLDANDNLFAAELHFDTSDYWSGNARIGTISLSVDLDGGEPQTWTASFESDASWTFTKA